MGSQPELLAAIATIAAAAIAGLVAFIISALSKYRKTPDFLQARIDTLRSDIAEFVAKNAALMAAAAENTGATIH